MGHRMKYYVAYYTELTENGMLQENITPDMLEREKEELLVQISFFQHERLIHLLVTLAFALMTVLSFLATLLLSLPILFVLTLCFLVLLIPYIMHYYLLENGTQKLYEAYDAMKAMSVNF